jgi:hypothetical protein
MTTRNQEIATTILQQLGGNRFLVITGSKSPTAIVNGLTLRLAKNKTRANVLKIVLTPADDYEIEFKYLAFGKGGVTEKVVRNFDGIQFDQLQDIFEEVTGLYTSLTPRRAA